MSNPFVTQRLLDDVRDELNRIYSNSGIEDRQPSPEEVVRSALVEIATDLRLDADQQGECNKVDECTAGALVRYRLADWLRRPDDPQLELARPQFDKESRMNYIDEIATALHEVSPSIDLAADEAMARAYALLVLTTGEQTTSRHVHDAWAMVRLATRPDHPDIVPFEELTPQTQAYDDKFRDAIRTIAQDRLRAAAV